MFPQLMFMKMKAYKTNLYITYMHAMRNGIKGRKFGNLFFILLSRVLNKFGQSFNIQVHDFPLTTRRKKINSFSSRKFYELRNVGMRIVMLICLVACVSNCDNNYGCNSNNTSQNRRDCNSVPCGNRSSTAG
jgi:hypothetical protein